MRTYRSRLLATTLAASVTLLASPAFAQIGSPEAEAEASDTSGEAIVVTGSRIQRPDLTSSSPISVVSDAEFELSGATTVEQVINTLPQVLPGLTGFSNNPGSGAATLNLRGLGETRTLVLVNNRRWMFYDTNQIVDLNTIPQFMIQGVDVVTGGASAVYGSDAVAGVVNFRLRTDLSGIMVGANYGLTERGDGRRYSFDAAFGSNFADNKGNVTVFANYTRRQSVFQGARDFSRTAAGDGCITPGSTNGASQIGTPFPSGVTVATCVARGGEVGLVPQGSATTPIGTFVVGTTNYTANPTGGGSRVFQDPADLYNFAPANYLQLPQERYLFGGYANYEAAEGVELYTELSFINNSVPQELAATPIGQTVQLQIASPFFNAQTRALLLQNDAAEPLAGGTRGDGYASTTVGYRFLQAGARNVDAQRTAFRVLGGVRGDITDKLRYDAYYLYSRTRNTQFQQGNVSRSRFAAALATEFVPGSTTEIRCRDAAARAAGCVPLNIFGSNLADPAAIRYTTINSTNIEISDLKNAVASVSGSLFNLGMGADDVGFAFGGEYRAMSSRYIPDTFLASGDVAGFNAGLPTSGGYNVKEVFGELRIPVMRDSLLYRVELNGAGRYSKYSLGEVGGTWTYTGGAEIAPIRDITFRGQYSRSVRAPNVQNLFGGNATGFPAVNDPCSDRGPASTRTDAVRALCVASGVPAANVFTRGVQPSAQIQANTGGNPLVQEETSDTYTFGAVIQPSFIPRLNITVDYFNIKVEDTIGTRFGSAATALELCYYVAQNLTDPVCSIFAGSRGPTGAIGQTNGGTNPNFVSDNTGKLSTSGIDMQVDYNIPLGFSMFGGTGSRLSLFYLGTWLDKYRSIAYTAFPQRVSIDEGTIALPTYRHTARASVSDGPGTLSLRWRYQGKGQDSRIDNIFLGTTRIGTDPALLPNAYVKAANYFDLTASFDVNDALTFNVGVNNMLDKKPPVLGAAAEQANTRPSFYDVLGRDFFVSVRARF